MSVTANVKRIAEALEDIADALVKLANPPVMSVDLGPMSTYQGGHSPYLGSTGCTCGVLGGPPCPKHYVGSPM